MDCRDCEYCKPPREDVEKSIFEEDTCTVMFCSDNDLNYKDYEIKDCVEFIQLKSSDEKAVKSRIIDKLKTA